MNWPEVVQILRDEATHRERRLHRMELLAQAGRVDFVVFAENRAYAKGVSDALSQAVELVEGTTSPADVDDLVVVLAQQGLEVDKIGARCDLTVREVADALALYVHTTMKGAAG